jgi:ABC-type uncharacterized transport system involved in gliding motility auxiliary subunit
VRIATVNRLALARILAVVGLLLAATAPVTWLLGGGGLLAGKLLLAAVALGAALALAGAGGARRFFTGRAAHFGVFTTASALLVLGLLVLANWAATARPVTLDLTKDRLHTLADDTVRTLAALPADVEALAFYRADEEAHEPTRALLRRYEAQSPRFRSRLVDPYAHPELVKQHEITDGGPRILLVMGEKRARVAEPTEEALTNGLVELGRGEARKIYVLTGHGEPALSAGDDRAISGAADGMRRDGFAVEPLSLLAQAEVPADADVVLVVGPRTRLLEPEVKALLAYADRGGKLGVWLEPGVDAGLDALLTRFGVEADDDLVVDPGQASQLFGGSPVNPVGVPVPGHPVPERLGGMNVVFPTARSLVALTSDDPARPRAQVLVLSTRDAWGETAVEELVKSGKAQLGDGEKSGPLPLAMASTRPGPPGAPGPGSRLLVVGDAEHMDDRYAQVLGNLDFFLNGVAWLGEQPDRIVIRPKGREGSRLVLSAGQLAAVRFVTLDALPVLLLGIGLTVWQLRRSR